MKEPYNLPCKKCYLRYSSYCIGCQHEAYGLGYENISEWIRARKESENE